MERRSADGEGKGTAGSDIRAEATKNPADAGPRAPAGRRAPGRRARTAGPCGPEGGPAWCPDGPPGGRPGAYPFTSTRRTIRRYWPLDPTHVWSVMDGLPCAAQAQLAPVVGRVVFHHLTT